jgi:hypothetical protein
MYTTWRYALRILCPTFLVGLLFTFCKYHMKLFTVHIATIGAIPVMARNLAHAIASALELAGPGHHVIRCERGGDW